MPDWNKDIIEDGVASGHFTCAHPQMAGLNMLMAAHTVALKGWFLRDVAVDDYIATQTELALAVVGVEISKVRSSRAVLTA